MSLGEEERYASGAIFTLALHLTQARSRSPGHRRRGQAALQSD